MPKSKSCKKKPPKRALALPDLEHARTAVLNSLIILQRKALTPNDFQSLEKVEERFLAFLAFQCYYESIATPFDWRFTKDDLAALIRKLDRGVTALRVAA